MKWVHYKPKARMRVLDHIFPDGIHIPDYFFGKNIVHLPTMKCHIYTTTTGAMKNAFGGLLSTHRHYTHSWIHETLVDLLAIQKEIHTGLFAIMDGTTAGNGPGPRTMFPVVKNFMLASADQVAIDAVSAQMMGFDPMSLEYIAAADEDGLGNGRPENIDIVGDDVSTENWHFTVGKNLMRRLGGDLMWFGPLKRFQKLLLPHAAGAHRSSRCPRPTTTTTAGAQGPQGLRPVARDDRVGAAVRPVRVGPADVRDAHGRRAQSDRARVMRAGRGLGRPLALAAAAGALFYVGFAAYSGFHKVMDALAHYAWATAAAALTLAAINYLLRFAKWELYLRRLGVRIPLRDSFGDFPIGFLAYGDAGQGGRGAEVVSSARGARRADGADGADRGRRAAHGPGGAGVARADRRRARSRAASGWRGWRWRSSAWRWRAWRRRSWRTR